MKKIFLSLVLMANVGFTFANVPVQEKLEKTNEFVVESEAKKPWYLALLDFIIKAEYEKGTNKVIDGVRYPCIDDGVCNFKGEVGTGVDIDRNISNISVEVGVFYGESFSTDKNLFAVPLNQAKEDPNFNLKQLTFTSSNSYKSEMPIGKMYFEIKKGVSYEVKIINDYAVVLLR